MSKEYRGYIFRFQRIANGKVAIALRGCYENWLTLGSVAPTQQSIRSFLDEVIDDGACRHLAYL